MTRRHPDQELPARLDAEFSDLLEELSACGHQASALIARTGLPRWCRKPLFYLLGYLARAEGRVTETDIGFAEALMKALQLSGRQRRKAIGQFQRGKAVDHLPASKALLMRLTGLFWPSPALRMAFCLCHAAQLHGRPQKLRRYRCEDAVDQLGLPVRISEDILASYASKVWITQPENQPRPTSYDQACQVLGVTRRESLAAIKRAYRKKVSECHPDKLAQQSLSPAEQARAKERLLRYQQAWELIRKEHAFNSKNPASSW
ncbi:MULTISPECIES: DnaJ domain-containing protein [Marinobacter]|uniref:Molecular chaperone DjlA n=1 Tax=Marinobacter profundi TaxID=2666256 RepID=A0A2G1UI33_9GAMM|nr:MULTISPECIES: DnaJ domain-containing protein [Marinobacter]MBD3658082.1 DnaJ domain-containing protein [Marinobacter sp.]PHQ14144.1 molecular chaperone DjlA [Marinobacter profundi]